MNNAMQIFGNTEFGQVRTLQINNVPWFVGKDIAEALGYEKTRNAIAAHVDPEDKKEAPIQGALGGRQNMTIINESGLYALIFGSKLESAKRFKHWITSEVLPALRRTGHYEMTGSSVASVPEIVETIQFFKKQEERGRKPEEVAQIVGEVYEQLYGVPKKFFKQPVKPAAALVEIPDEQYQEYSKQVMSIGLVHNKGIFLRCAEFNDFCSRNGISERKFRRWLFQNGYIVGYRDQGKTEYTVNVWLNGSAVRGILFKK